MQHWGGKTAQKLSTAHPTLPFELNFVETQDAAAGADKNLRIVRRGNGSGFIAVLRDERAVEDF